MFHFEYVASTEYYFKTLCYNYLMKRFVRVAPLVLMALAGFLLFALEQKLVGYVALTGSLFTAWLINKQMARDLSLVAIGVTIVSLVPVTTDISYLHMLQMGLAMIAAIAIPYFVSRYVYKDHLYDSRSDSRNRGTGPNGCTWGWS